MICICLLWKSRDAAPSAPLPVCGTIADVGVSYRQILALLHSQALLDLRLVLEWLPETRLLKALLALTDPTAGVSKAALPPLLREALSAFGARDASGSGSLIIDYPLYTELLRVRHGANCLW